LYLQDVRKLQKKKIQKKSYNLLNIYESAPSDLNQLVETRRTFYYESILPVHSCFANHCNSSKDIFLQRWKPFYHSKFNKKCLGNSYEVCARDPKPKNGAGGHWAPLTKVHFPIVGAGSIRIREDLLSTVQSSKRSRTEARTTRTSKSCVNLFLTKWVH
jgi:hypothetical protein